MSVLRLLRILAFLLTGATLASPAVAQALFETKAAQAYMIEAETGSILFAKDADAPVPPASLAKLMTMEVVFNAIKAGRLKMDDGFYISENAWKKGGSSSGGSTMFAELKSTVPLDALVQGTIVQSANDACIAIAEGMAGTEENFAALMTERAREIGLVRSEFRNATGLPADGQQVTMRELVMLAQHIWRNYPEFYRFYSQPDFTWNKITQKNRNPLLRMDIGADGLKTGFTDASGYAIVGSVNRNGRRLFLAMSGLASEAQRAEEARKMLDWGIRAFEKRELFGAETVVGEAGLYGGAKKGVALVARTPIAVLIPITNRDRLKARIVYTGPVLAPVAKGQPIGSLKVWIGDTLSGETKLYAAEDVPVGPIHRRALDALQELLVGWMR
ncbi:MAG: D-alanyl-D-alanine carboxypeptidase family protein [Rhizobiaceae bacterium]